MKNDFEYDEIAEEIFGPIFGIIAKDIIDTTGKTSGELLDIGCGGGHMGYAVMNEGCYSHAYFMDIKPEALSAAESRGKALGLTEKIDYVLGNVESMPFDDSMFDLVISRGSMPFWDDQVSAFSEIFRVLKPNGYAYVGGGFGNKEQRDRINKAFANNDRGFRPFDRSKSKALPDKEYQNLFSTWNCESEIISDPDRGHWFVIKKVANDK